MKPLFPHLLILLLLITGSLWSCADEPSAKEYIYVGTFHGENSEGLYVFEFDREQGTFRQIQTVSDRQEPNFQAIHPNGDYLYSVSGQAFSDDTNHGTVSAYRIDRETGRLELINERSSEGRHPAHVSVDPLGRFVYASNYSSGNLSVFSIEEDGSLSKVLDVVQHEGSSVNEQRQRAPHVHAADPSPDGRFLYVSDLGIDRIMIYEVDQDTGILSPAATPYAGNEPGSGPRHFTIHPNGGFAYSVEELSVTIASFTVDSETGRLDQFQRLSLLPEGAEAAGHMSAADVHISPDGNFLYATVRGEDILSIFSIDPSTGELTSVGHEPTRGGHPRNFMIDQKGEFILVANRDDDNVVFFSREHQSGTLEATGIELDVPLAVCVTQFIVE